MSLLLSSRPLVVIPELAVRLGLAEAILLQQIQYWVTETTSGVEYRGRRWIYNTIEGWQKQLPFYSESTIKRALANLKRFGVLLIEQINKSNHDRTNYYAINYESEMLVDEVNLTLSSVQEPDCRVGQNDPFDEGKKIRSIRPKRPDLTETTTEITTENKSLLSRNSDESLDELELVQQVQTKPTKPDAAIITPSGKAWGTKEDLECAEWIFSRVQLINPTAKQPNWADWANDVRLMRQIDHRTHREICELFRAANADSFWCKNILSPRKLREQWDNLKVRLATGSNVAGASTVKGGHWNSVEAWEDTL